MSDALGIPLSLLMSADKFNSHRSFNIINLNFPHYYYKRHE
ncbi:hypothetical protein B194_3018 [Serratia plymuthica A30]|nr:hypothetical protein B194_3018 [Serratia plymuthica A30]